LKLGRQSSYAIDGLLVLAGKPFGTVMLLRDIAEAGSVPENFLAKIFQKLTRSGVLASSRGAVRGYALACKPTDLSIKQILLPLEGSDLFDRCIFWSYRCADADPCPLHFRWKKVRERIIAELLERTTLADLANARSHKQTGARRQVKK
jgi:Rrf2 family transcriptional regulator, iron-sulfur cluster assembly transcription factor